MRLPLVIEADGILLDAFQSGDAEAVAFLAGDWELAKWTASIPYPYTEKGAKNWIAMQREDEANAVYAIRSHDYLIGCINCRTDTGEIGYWVGRRYWNRGLATCALRVLISALPDEMRRIVWAATLPDNAASRRVLQKCGFRFDGQVQTGARLRHLGTLLDRFVLSMGGPAR